MAIKSAWSLLALASVVLATKYQQQEQCAVQFDGRLPAGSTPAAFDKADGIYDPDYVKGKGLKWSDIIKIPRVPPSLVCLHSLLAFPFSYGKYGEANLGVMISLITMGGPRRFLSK
jgi:hypothetical protein